MVTNFSISLKTTRVQGIVMDTASTSLLNMVEYNLLLLHTFFSSRCVVSGLDLEDATHLLNSVFLQVNLPPG